MNVSRTIMAATLFIAGISACAGVKEDRAGHSVKPCPLIYISTSFENASPLFWEINEAGEANVFLLYDHERSSPNRAAGHWHFCVEAPKGSEITIVLNNLLNIYNGRKASPAKDKTISLSGTDMSCNAWIFYRRYVST